ncbi:hypothetical protein B0T10DRAFT_606713 [Thelonectria olida]|uniref:DUF6536 domain-containing protein n=1 Tax=Thelonectria olida TaxID=1576542 RepID=A0A9P8W4Y6_9HYPO|nr:hypothetical protein B0T10DRAFT_606713 [Thelonectria olida]
MTSPPQLPPDSVQLEDIPLISYIAQVGRQSSHESGSKANSEDNRSASFHAGFVAERSILSRWFPQINDDETKSWRIWLSRRSRALMIQIGLIGLILLTNLSLTIFAIARYGSEKGVGLIYEGDCQTVKDLDQWIHLLINLLGTGMLGASNYCMQLQAAPTRENLNKAHANGRWLDIGVPSLRNLKHLDVRRRITWFILALSSVPIHLIYNSAVFQSFASNNYAVAVVKDSFLDGASFDFATARTRQSGDPGWDDFRVDPDYINYTDVFLGVQKNASTYQRLNLTACFELYDDYWKPQGNVIVQVENTTLQTPTNDSLLLFAYIVPRWDDWGKNMWALGNGTGKFVAQSPTHPVTEWYLGLPHYRVSSCLVQDPDTIKLTCRFQYSPQILITVCLMNFVKAGIMLWIWESRRKEKHDSGSIDAQPLYTLGDAIASFMRRPDPTTIDMGLATKYDFLRPRKPWFSLHSKDPELNREPREFRKQSMFWMQAASVKRWAILVSFCSLAILVGGVLLSVAFHNLHHRNIKTDFAGLQDLGFGAVTPYTYLVTGLPRDDPAGLIANVLVANLAQLVLSMVYLLYNTMLSTFLVQREFSFMYKTEKRKTLRVSEPIGIQRSSYFISLPLRYGVPLYVTSGFMHFLFSQSIFLSRITAYFPDGTEDKRASFSTCSYSPIAIITTMIVGGFLVLSIILLGCRKYDGTMRMVATNSRAISAACHALEADREDGYLMPVQWGVIRRTGGIGKLAFTTAPPDQMGEVVEGKKYL